MAATACAQYGGLEGHGHVIQDYHVSEFIVYYAK